MADSSSSNDLSGKLLIAMPGMGDARFNRAVIYVCAHSPEGSMGLIVNKPSYELSFKELLDQMSIDAAPDITPPQVHFGGPVELGRGFVLHSGDYTQSDGTLSLDTDFGMTASMDVLEDLAHGTGPHLAIVALGYAGWGPGQLEAEILSNGWLTCDASHDLVFGADNDRKWTAALKSIGIDPLLLSASAGSA